MVVVMSELVRGRSNMSQHQPDPRIRREALVIMEVDGQVVAGIVVDDNADNPIRLVETGGRTVGMFADELEVVDRDTFEIVIYLQQTRGQDGTATVAL